MHDCRRTDTCLVGEYTTGYTFLDGKRHGCTSHTANCCITGKCRFYYIIDGSRDHIRMKDNNDQTESNIDQCHNRSQDSRYICDLFQTTTDYQSIQYQNNNCNYPQRDTDSSLTIQRVCNSICLKRSTGNERYHDGKYSKCASQNLT